MFGIRTRRWKASLALAGMGTVGFALGAWQARLPIASAETPVVPAAATSQQSDYSQRVVAYINGDVPITREDLGEYLIARQGSAKLENLVNMKIIEHACKQRNITVTDAEVEAAMDSDLEQLHVDRATFVKQFLKQYNKTLFEWKEDVIRPRLMMTKLSGLDIKVDDAEARKLFDTTYGEKVQCRIIIWENTPGVSAMTTALRAYDSIRKSEAEFDRAARNQGVASLAAVAGKIAPIGHGSAEPGKDYIEKIAWKLNNNEVSEVFELPGQGVAVMKCDGHVPADKSHSFDKEKEYFRKQIYEQKLSKAIPKVFAKLREQAKPMMVLKYGTSNPNVEKTIIEEQKLLNQPAVPLPPSNPTPPKK
jgi:parvulin-like peptidyl-prolyl isomerase